MSGIFLCYDASSRNCRVLTGLEIPGIEEVMERREILLVVREKLVCIV